ncbi:transposase [Nonomuraea endophytica]
MRDTRSGRCPPEEDRRMLNGIVWRIRTGSAWRDVPVPSVRPEGREND